MVEVYGFVIGVCFFCGVCVRFVFESGHGVALYVFVDGVVFVVDFESSVYGVGLSHFLFSGCPI